MTTDPKTDRSLEELRGAFDPNRFLTNAKNTAELVAGILKNALAGNGKVLSLPDPADALQEFSVERGQSLEQLFETVVQHSIKLHHPHYMGHQISPPLPAAATASLLVDLLNNGMGVYEMGVAGTAVEHQVVRLVADHFGFGGEAGGFLTSGGSLANLTALLAARARQTDDDVWNRGATGCQHVVLVSEAAHYCVDRAARIMGLGGQGIYRVPTDANYRMKTELLPEIQQELQGAGKQVIAVVGSACTTSTGSYDSLDAIADFCEQRGIWFHVDGAHGAAVAFAPNHKHLIAGIHRADSVALDFHKLLMTPAITSALVFRQGSVAYRTFSLEAEYLFDEPDKQEWFNLARRTFECTKQMMGLKVLSIIKAHGVGIFDANINRLFHLTQEFSHLLNDHPDFEIAVAPQANIVCFRYRNGAAENLDAVNERIRTELVRQGDYYIVTTTLRGETWLRSTICNPFTRREHFEGLLGRLAELADEIGNGGPP